ncbi:MAG: TIGR03943 family protein [Roseibacillus sp.]
MKTTITQVIFSLATIAWGLVPVYLYSSGLISKYLSSSFHLVSLIGGLAMIVLGAFNLLHAGRMLGCGHDHHDHGNGHDHHDQNPVAAILLMVLPVALCCGFTNHEYSTKALTWKGLYKKRSSRSSLFSSKREPFTRALLEKTTPRTAEGNYQLTITELYWSAGDEEIMKAYEGLPAELEGRLIEEDSKLNPKGNRKRLYRVFMTCCAADAQVLGLALEFEGPLPGLADKTWIKVTGTVGYERIDKQDFAYLKVANLKTGPAPPPGNPFRRNY